MLEFEGKREQVLELASHRGYKWATVTGLLSTAAVAAAQHYSAGFRLKTNVSGKVALAVMPPLGMYFLIAERTMVGAQLDPSKYGIYPKGHVEAVKEKRRDTLQWYHHLANWCYTNPFALLGGVGLPAVASIFYAQNKAHQGMQLSQRIMQTRVLGQMTILGCLVGTMGFRDYMYKSGGLFVQDEDGQVHHEHKAESH